VVLPVIPLLFTQLFLLLLNTTVAQLVVKIVMLMVVVSIIRPRVRFIHKVCHLWYFLPRRSSTQHKVLSLIERRWFLIPGTRRSTELEFASLQGTEAVAYASTSELLLTGDIGVSETTTTSTSSTATHIVKVTLHQLILQTVLSRS